MGCSSRALQGPLGRIGVALGATLMVGSLAACGSTSASDGDKTITLKVGDVFTTEEPINKSLVNVVAEIEKKTEGRVKVDLFPNAELGGDLDVLEQAAMGAPVISIVNPTFVSERGVPDMKIAAGPFMFTSPEQSTCFMGSDYWKGLTDQLEAKSGLVSISWDWYLGDRNIISDKGFAQPGDLRGVKIRIPSDKTWETLFSTLGASPTVLEWSEVYSALTEGVVDAAEAPLTTLLGARLNEAAKTITLTGHYNVPSGFVINEKVWDRISEADRDVIVAEFKTGAAAATAAAVEQGQAARATLEGEGVKFIDADHDAYATAVEPFYTKFSEWSDGAVEKTKAAAQACAS